MSARRDFLFKVSKLFSATVAAPVLFQADNLVRALPSDYHFYFKIQAGHIDFSKENESASATYSLKANPKHNRAAILKIDEEMKAAGKLKDYKFVTAPGTQEFHYVFSDISAFNDWTARVEAERLFPLEERSPAFVFYEKKGLSSEIKNQPWKRVVG